MSESARFIGPVDRIIFLRSMGGLHALDAAELSGLAQAVEERFFPKGTRFMRDGEVADSCHFLAQGTVSVGRGGKVQRVLRAPYTVGFLAALSRDPDGLDAVADTDVTTLECPADYMLELMEENTRLTEAALRQVTAQLVQVQRVLEAHGHLHRSEPVETPYPERELDFVQRLTRLRQGGPYRDASLDAVATIARRLEEVRMPAGEVLFREGDAADFGVQVVHGVLACEGGGRSFRMGPGSVVGYFETLARTRRTYTARAEGRIVLLQGMQEVFLDVMEDNPELGLAFVSFFSGLLDKLYTRLADVGLSEHV